MAACEGVIAALRGNLRTARELRARLEAGLPPDAASVGLCEDLWNGSIAAACAIEAAGTSLRARARAVRLSPPVAAPRQS